MFGASRPAGKPTRLCSTVALLWIVSGTATAEAGSIGFRVDTDIDTTVGLSVKVTLTQTGNEAASDVAATVEFLDRATTGSPVARFDPGQNHVWEMRLRDEPLPPGAYAVVVRVRYSDANGYPFEITSVAPAVTGGNSGPRVTGAFVLPKVPANGDADGTLELKKPENGRSGPFEGVLVAPRGLRMTPARFPIEFDHDGKATIKVSLENDKLLAGTSVNLFALISNDQFGVHQTDTVRGTLRVIPAESLLSAATFYRAAAAVAGLLVVLELFGVRRRGA